MEWEGEETGLPYGTIVRVKWSGEPAEVRSFIPVGKLVGLCAWTRPVAMQGLTVDRKDLIVLCLGNDPVIYEK